MKAIKFVLVILFSIAFVACGGSSSGPNGGQAITATANTTAQSLTVGTAMAGFQPLTPIDGATPYTFSYAGTLPAGLSFSASTGAVTGTPAAVYATASLFFSVKDANNVVASTTSTVRFTVVAAPVNITATANTTAQNLTIGSTMTSFTPLTATGGATPYTFSYTGTLPAGLSFNTGTGAVTGTPTAVYPTASLFFSVKDANNVVASTTSTVSFTVAASGLPAGYVVQDGLTWMPVTSTLYTWTNANAYCANTTINGVTGWRQPTQTELSALYAAYPDNSGIWLGNSVLLGQGWTLGSTWSSTFYTAGSHSYVYLNNGSVIRSYDTYFEYVSCVR